MLTRSGVEVEVGGKRGRPRRVGRLRLWWHPGALHGSTLIQEPPGSRGLRTVVILAGPVASLVGVALGCYAGAAVFDRLAPRLAAFVFAWAHLRVFLYTSLPAFGGRAGGGPSARGGDLRDLLAVWRRSGRANAPGPR